jgi:hypothetical protein
MSQETLPTVAEQSAPDYTGPVVLTESEIALASGENIQVVDGLAGLAPPIAEPASTETEVQPAEEVQDFSFADATSYGLTVEEAEELGQNGYEKFTKALAKQMLELGKSAKPSTEATKEVDPTVVEKPSSKDDNVFGIDFSQYNPDDYDDLTNNLVKTLKVVGPRLEQLERQLLSTTQPQQNPAQDDVAVRVNRVIDKLDEGFFGTAIKDDKFQTINQDHFTNRQTLLDTAAAIEQGFINSGRPVPSPERLLANAFQLAFPEQSSRLQSEERKQKLQTQSVKRRSVGSTNRSPAKRSSDDPMDEIVNDPEIMRAWNEMQNEL